MNPAPDLLLRDIHEPLAPSWWPPAPGWWLVALVLLAAVAWGGWRRWRRRRRHLAAQRLFDATLATLPRKETKWQVSPSCSPCMNQASLSASNILVLTAREACCPLLFSTTVATVPSPHKEENRSERDAGT